MGKGYGRVDRQPRPHREGTAAGWTTSMETLTASAVPVAQGRAVLGLLPDGLSPCGVGHHSLETAGMG